MHDDAEHSDPSGTLPREELNPLLNPLLAQNMGRWAEVYYKAAPEDREQAVQGLLHELQVGPRVEASTSPQQSVEHDGFEVHESSGLYEPESSDSLVRCPQCGHENRRDYNFCGACRAPLVGGEEVVGRVREQQDARFLLDPIVDPEFESDRDAKQSSLPGHLWQKDLDPQQIHEQRSGRRKWQIAEAARVANNSALRDDRQQAAGNGHYFDEVRNRRGAADADLFQLPSLVEPRRSYRLYVGAALALLIAFLLYRAWRSEQPSLFATHTSPQVPAVTSENSNAPAAPKSDTTQGEAAQPPSSQTNASPQSNIASPTNPPFSAAPPAAAGNARVKQAAEKAQAAEAAETQPAAISSSSVAGGATELARAKDFLNGTGGKEQNSAQAAAWLWKSVSKQNAEASTLLAELYMKGDGVSKSCDQARVLLDAAARKGRKDAAERLSHLSAFGCQ